MLRVLLGCVAGFLILPSNAVGIPGNASLSNLLQSGAANSNIAGTIIFNNGAGGTAWSGQALKSASYSFYTDTGCLGSNASTGGAISPAFSPVNGQSYTFNAANIYTLIQDTTGNATLYHSFSLFFNNDASAADGTTGADNSGTCACFNLTCASGECIGADTASNVAFSTTHCVAP